MVLCKNDLETRNRVGAISTLKDFNYEDWTTSQSATSISNLTAKQLNYWQSRQLPDEQEGLPRRRAVNQHQGYTEYFAAKRRDPDTGEQTTVAELVAEYTSPKVVLLACIATKPEARCSGIGSALLSNFRQAVARDNPDATIFLEVEDPDIVNISEEERSIRTRRLNWYLRQGAVIWKGHYEMPNPFDKRRRGKKSIFMALPKEYEQITCEQLQEAALQVLVSYGISNNHWLYKKVARQPASLVSQPAVVLENKKEHQGLAQISYEKTKPDFLFQTLRFLKRTLQISTGISTISDAFMVALPPEEAIKKVLELEREDLRRKFFGGLENLGQIGNFAPLSEVRI